MLARGLALAGHATMAWNFRSRMARTSLRIVDSLCAIPASAWDALVGDRPLLSHAFLHALHESGCAAPETGWTPRYLTAWRGELLVGAMPLYVKAHSYGEYVFDWSWADAYHRNGVEYYPKLLSAIPFTPVTGPRLMAIDGAARQELITFLIGQQQSSGMSSTHILFPPEDQ